MSKPEDIGEIEKFLNNTKKDLHDFVYYFMDFFTPSKLRPTIKDFQNNFDLISSEIDSMRKTLFDNKKYQGLQNHGLIGPELERKMLMYSIIRKDYQNSKIAFVRSFIELEEKIKSIPNRHVKKVSDLPHELYKLYKKSNQILRKLKISKERFYEFLNSILTSLADALGIGGIVSEYKDSLEIATKKENSIQFNIVVFKLDPKLFDRMREYSNNPEFSTIKKS